MERKERNNEIEREKREGERERGKDRKLILRDSVWYNTAGVIQTITNKKQISNYK
jgi:hypothetical protein